jgi:hypothetical protein
MKNWISYFILSMTPLGLAANCDCYTSYIPCDEEIQYVDYTPWEAGDDAGLWCLPGSRCTESLPTRPSGAQIYYDLGHLCHKNRYPSEYTPEEWRTIMLHMRVMMPMTAWDHRMVLTFLQNRNPVVQTHEEVAKKDNEKIGQNSDSLGDVVGPVSEGAPAIGSTVFAGYTSKFNYIFTGGIAAGYFHPFPSFFGDLDGNNSFYYFFSPSFAASYGDSILMFARIGIANQAQTASFALPLAYVAYIYNDYVTFVAGKFPIPIGSLYSYFSSYVTSKLFLPYIIYPSTIYPYQDIGFEVKGAIPLCKFGEFFRRSSFTYELWVGNGPSEVNSFSGSPFPNGSINFNPTGGNAPDNNNEVAWGGRFAWQHNDRQWYGISYMRGRWSSNKVAFSGDGLGKKRVFQAAVFDWNMNIDHSTVFRGDYMWTQYEGNLPQFPWVRQTAYWAELALGLDHISWISQDIYCWKPCLWDRLEFVMRSCQVWSQPSGATNLGFDYSGFDRRTFTLGVNYYFTNTFRALFQYDFNYGDGAHNFVRESITGSSKKTGYNNNVWIFMFLFSW